jgi:anti-sigma factor ChrR (cupin superfamily)
MDAVTPKAKHDTADTHSHVVKPQNMEWQKTRFPGCEAKTLLFDRSTGLMTALMRFAPGAVLPDHEHVNIEQTYVLEGRLVDKEGPAAGIEANKGEFIWREAGSRHVAWCPEGGLMLAIFQVPNKFFEADGRVVDAAGQDWDETWGHTGKV